MPILKLCFAIYAAPAKGDFVSKSLKDALIYESVHLCRPAIVCSYASAKDFCRNKQYDNARVSG